MPLAALLAQDNTKRGHAAHVEQRVDQLRADHGFQLVAVGGGAEMRDLEPVLAVAPVLVALQEVAVLIALDRELQTLVATGPVLDDQASLTGNVGLQGDQLDEN